MEKQDEERDTDKHSKTEKYLYYLDSAFVLFCIPIVITIFNCAFQGGYYSAHKIPFIYISSSDFSLLLNNTEILFNDFTVVIGIIIFCIIVKNVISSIKFKKLSKKSNNGLCIAIFIILIGMLIFDIIRKQTTSIVFLTLELLGIILIYSVFVIPKRIREKRLNKTIQKSQESNDDAVIEEYIAQDDENRLKVQQAEKTINKVIDKYETVSKFFCFGILLITIIVSGRVCGVQAAAHQKDFSIVTYEEQKYIICGIYDGRYIIQLIDLNSKKDEQKFQYRLVEIGEIKELIESITIQ